MENKIHIAFGFHVNCYHSYRGDTNDNLGFGSDIRIIRKIIDILNICNEEGIPVKGTWDSENFFSLGEILPKYAPDIIEGMKERVKKYGDENIIMGYSNGALGAMTEEELEASIELAVTNSQGSGLQDIFGEYEKIVRPQEVMFSPSQVRVYNKLGVKALCLYYSCVPFDAFRTIVPKLSDEAAFNPITYTYNGESMTIIPTYNNSDICDAGCLRAWVKELHLKQVSGEIKNDLFLFINMDADAIFWETLNIPVIQGKIANTDGINGLVREVADLDYVVFDTPGGYLKNHKPVGHIAFTQDTADGNFTGYASWAEKPYNRKIWTAIERSRAMARVNASVDSDSKSFMDRVTLLSTTHFGLATPVLNIQREKKADELALAVVKSEADALESKDKLTILNSNHSSLAAIQLKVDADIKSVSQIMLKSDDLESYAILPMDDELASIFLIAKFREIKEQYTLDVIMAECKENMTSPSIHLTAGSTDIKFSVHGNIYSVKAGDKEIGDTDFLESFITYDHEKYAFEREKVKSLDLGGNAEGLRVSGKIHLPGEIEHGRYAFDFFKVDGINQIFVKTDVKYPHTPETTSISTENSSLGRYSDMKWSETAAFQITPKLTGDVSVIKRNFMGDISTFRTQSFGECDEKNKALASFNHQLTAGLVGLTDGESGLVVANSRQVLSSMAHCPMRLDADKTVHMNMFGTYYGRQRHHWSRANGEIYDTYTLVAPQSKSIAPSYNGNHEIAMLSLCAFEGGLPDDSSMNDILAFADGVVVVDNHSLLKPFYDDNVKFKETKADGIQENKLMSPVFTGIKGNLGKFIAKGARAIGHIVAQQIKAK